MHFERIQDFLFKYNKYFSDKNEERKRIRMIVAEVSGINLSDREFTILRGELFIRGNSVSKNELFIHKKRILAELHKNGLTGIHDVH
ncbi:MAG: hypothetical protein AAB869_02445 [Patescibacteria group bacterium]